MIQTLEEFKNNTGFDLLLATIVKAIDESPDNGGGLAPESYAGDDFLFSIVISIALEKGNKCSWMAKNLIALCNDNEHTCGSFLRSCLKIDVDKDMLIQRIERPNDQMANSVFNLVMGQILDGGIWTAIRALSWFEEKKEKWDKLSLLEDSKKTFRYNNKIGMKQIKKERKNIKAEKRPEKCISIMNKIKKIFSLDYLDNKKKTSNDQTISKKEATTPTSVKHSLLQEKKSGAISTKRSNPNELNYPMKVVYIRKYEHTEMELKLIVTEGYICLGETIFICLKDKNENIERKWKVSPRRLSFWDTSKGYVPVQDTSIAGTYYMYISMQDALDMMSYPLETFQVFSAK